MRFLLLMFRSSFRNPNISPGICIGTFYKRCSLQNVPAFSESFLAISKPSFLFSPTIETYFAVIINIIYIWTYNLLVTVFFFFSVSKWSIIARFHTVCTINHRDIILPTRFVVYDSGPPYSYEYVGIFFCFFVLYKLVFNGV